MTWKAMLAALTMAVLISACGTSAAASPRSFATLPPEAFRPVRIVEHADSAASASPSMATPTPSPRPTRTASPRPTATRGPSVTLRGEASWGPFSGHVVTRYPRGTIVRVCGKLGCTGRVRSWGYGPAKYTGRIADLDVHVFERVCGPRWRGVCQITLQVWR